MKTIKIIIISAILILMLFLAFYKTNSLNIEGNWEGRKIVIDGEQLYPKAIDSFFHIYPQIIINGWGNSISIPTDKDDLKANFSIKQTADKKYQIILKSNKKALNGNFNLSIDTIHLGPLFYKVLIEIESEKTKIYFEKQVILEPWKPEFPRKGAV